MKQVVMERFGHVKVKRHLGIYTENGKSEFGKGVKLYLNVRKGKAAHIMIYVSNYGKMAHTKQNWFIA